MIIDLVTLQILGLFFATLGVMVYSAGIRHLHKEQKKIIDLEKCKLDNLNENIKLKAERLISDIDELTKRKNDVECTISASKNEIADLHNRKISLQKYLDTADGKNELVETQKKLENLQKEIDDLLKSKSKRSKGEIIAVFRVYKTQICSCVFDSLLEEASALWVQYPDLILEITTEKVNYWKGSSKESLQKLAKANEGFSWEVSESFYLKISK